jgi:Protein of unknown function (DUF2500).
MYIENVVSEIFPILFGLAFLIVFGVILTKFIGSVRRGVKNSRSPLLTVPAKVVSKRIDVRGDHSYTSYYVTFEMESGERVELSADGREYGMLVEKDVGLLSYRGTRLVSFERKKISGEA